MIDRRVIELGERVALDLFAARFPNDRPTVFDVGANAGAYGAEVLDRFPEARLVCFEPQGTCELASSGDVRVESMAVGDHGGSLWLWRDRRGSFHASVHRREHPDLGEFKPVEVEAVTLDGYCARTGVAHIDWLKIDTEGHELAALHGATQMLNHGRISVVQFEFNENAALAGTSFLCFWTLLRANGFALYREGDDALELIPAYDRSEEAGADTGARLRNYLAVHADAEWMRA